LFFEKGMGVSSAQLPFSWRQLGQAVGVKYICCVLAACGLNLVNANVCADWNRVKSNWHKVCLKKSLFTIKQLFHQQTKIHLGQETP
jgi:hypothetical protein